MKIAIDNIIGNIPKTAYSHKGGWSHLWKDTLSSQGHIVDVLNGDMPWDGYDMVAIDFGMEVSDRFTKTGEHVLNLFGGANEALFEKVSKVLSFTGELVCLDMPMPNVGTLLRKRIGAATTYPGIDSRWCDRVDDRLRSCGSYRQDQYVKSSGLIVGDSHSLSMRPTGAACLRNDGMTLHGMLNRRVIQEEARRYPGATICVSGGSIDIRHHLMRQDDPWAALTSLLDRYQAALREVPVDNRLELSYAVPVEDESRKIPGTGYYKGTPFFGSRADRLALTMAFNEGIELIAYRNGWSVNRLPHEWYTMDGVEFMKNIMERPKSVHIARPFYRWTTDYGREVFA